MDRSIISRIAAQTRPLTLAASALAFLVAGFATLANHLYGLALGLVWTSVFATVATGVALVRQAARAFEPAMSHVPREHMPFDHVSFVAAVPERIDS